MADKTAELALKFVTLLRRELTAEQWDEMRAKNGTGEYTLACASHDYLDANMVMAAAFKEVHDREVAFSDEPDADADVDAWNAAWTLARQTVLTTKPTMSERQRDLARHALGLPSIRRSSYRNRYVCSESGPTWSNWMLMELTGLAENDPDFSSNGHVLFSLTRRGAEMALKKGERLNPEDFPARA